MKQRFGIQRNFCSERSLVGRMNDWRIRGNGKERMKMRVCHQTHAKAMKVVRRIQ